MSAGYFAKLLDDNVVAQKATAYAYIVPPVWDTVKERPSSARGLNSVMLQSEAASLGALQAEAEKRPLLPPGLLSKGSYYEKLRQSNERFQSDRSQLTGE